MVIREVASDADREAVQMLLREAFEVRAGVGDAFAQLYLKVEDALSFVAVIDSRVVGHVLLALRAFNIDGVKVPGGILAMVAVSPHCRGQGIGRALIQEAEIKARNAGVLLLQVAGDPHFYMRFGFIPAYVQARAGIEIAKGQNAKPLGLREVTVADLEDLAALSKIESPVGSVIADEARWQWVLDSQHPASLFMCNDHLLGFCAVGDACLINREMGFVRGCWNQEVLAIYEAASFDEISAGDLLENVDRWARGLECQKIELHLPPQNRLMQAAVSRGAVCEVAEENELQIKLMDMSGIWALCADLFLNRAQEAGLSGGVRLRIGEGSFELDFGEQGVLGKQNEIFLPEIGFARALLGADRVVEHLDLPEVSDLYHMLDALFPVKEPFFWMADSF